MKKRFRTALICIILALVMAVLSPLQVFAASKKQYISDIRMADSVKKLEALGYTALNQDLNAGGNEGFTYIGYKTTDDPAEAITDISIMDMKGGYSISDYKEMLKRQKDAVREQTEIYRFAINEFRTRYDEGNTGAMLAFKNLNNFIEDDSGRLIGDLFLDPALSDDILVKIFMEASIVVNGAIADSLAVGLAVNGEENWMEKLGHVEPAGEEYFEDAEILLPAAQQLTETMQYYLNAGVDIADEAALTAYAETLTDTELQQFIDSASLYESLHSYSYAGGTLADLFLNPDLSAEDLYSVVSVLTPGQLAIAKLTGFNTLITAAVDNGAYLDNVEAILAASGKSLENSEKVSVYIGVDRSFYRGGVALTSDAKRQAASTGDNSWYHGNVSKVVETTLTLLSGTAALFSALALGVTIYCSKGALAAEATIDYLYGRCGSNIALYAEILSARNAAPILKALSGVFYIAMFVSLAIAALLAGLYFILEIYSYYHPNYRDIPLILMDLKYGEDDEVGDWEKYIRYDVVLDENGNAADLNSFSGKQWNCMYVTRDNCAGDPITADSLLAQYGDSTTPRGYFPAHYFGQADAFDLNSHCYNNDVGGIFLYFQRDVGAFASETASVFGGGALPVLTGIGGLVVGLLCMTFLAKKKKEATT